MAERVIEYKISARDEASGVVQRFGENLKRVAKTTQTVELAPIREVNRTEDDQAYRDARARRIKQIRSDTMAEAETRRKAIAEARVEEDLFGPKEQVPRRPLRTPDRSAEVQSERDAFAAQLRTARAVGDRDARAELVRRFREDREIARRERAAFLADEVQFGRQIAMERRRQRQQLAGPGGGKGGILDTLKSSFGRGSTAKEVTEILAGGGAIAGLAIVGTMLRDSAQRAALVVREFEEGKKSAGEVAEALAGSIPVLGSIFQAGRAIRELFSQENAEQERRLGIEQKIEQSQKRYLALVREGRQALKENAAIVRQMLQDAALVGQTGFRRENLAGQFEFQNQRQRLVDEIEAAKKKQNEDLQNPALVADRKALSTFVMPPEPVFDPTTGETAAMDFEEAKARYAQAQEDRQRLSKRIADEETKIKDNAAGAIAAGNEKIKALETKFAAERKELAERSAREREQAERDFNQRMNTLGTSTESMRLRAAGRGDEADLKQLGDEFVREQNAVAERQREQLRQRPDDKKIIDDQAERELYALRQNFIAKGEQLRRDAQLRRERETADGEARVSGIEDQAMADRLRMAGRGLDAELLLIEQAREEKLRQINQQAADEIRADASREKEIRERAERERAAVNADAETKTTGAKREDRERQFDRGSQIIQGRIDMLRQEAEFGNVAAGVEARRLEIAQQFARRREDIRKLLKDETLSAEQRLELQRQLAATEGQEAKAIARAGAGTGPVTATASGQSSRFLAGAQGFANPLMRPMETTAKNTGTANTLLTDVKKVMTDIYDIFRNDDDEDDSI